VSYALAVPNLLERLQELEREGVQLVHAGVPFAPQVEPFIYFYFANFQNISTGPLNGHDYNVQIVLGAKWQDSEVSETELAALIDAMPALFYAQQTNDLGEYTTAKDDDGNTLPSLGGLNLNATLVAGEGILPSDRFPYRGVRWTLRIREKGIT
jgi:hypothetical protein